MRANSRRSPGVSLGQYLGGKDSLTIPYRESIVRFALVVTTEECKFGITSGWYRSTRDAHPASLYVGVFLLRSDIALPDKTVTGLEILLFFGKFQEK